MLSQQLQIFLKVADCGSFTKAAKALFVTPASVMKQMNAFELRLGETLFTRSNQGIALTAAGKALYTEGMRLAADAETALLSVKKAADQERKVIRVGSSLLNPSKVLTDIWAPLRDAYPQYGLRIVTYEDTKEQILSVIASLGQKIDVLVGSFASRKMWEQADYLPLGFYRFCIAVPQRHALAAKKCVSLRDLYGCRLMMVKYGDADAINQFYEMLLREHRQIDIEETSYYYDVDTFNVCEQTGMPLLTLEAWAGIHPFLVTLPLTEGYGVSYGLLYAKHPSEDVKQFLNIIKRHVNERSDE